MHLTRIAGRKGRVPAACRCLMAAAIAVLSLAGSAAAAVIPWQSQKFEYVADRKDVKDVLRDLGASQHVMTWISPQVEGSVTGNFNETPQRFLDRMAATFGFAWYYDGAVLRVTGANEAQSATIALQRASTAQVKRALTRLGVTDPRFPVLYDDETGSVVVSGPPRLVELVQDIARLIDRGREDANRTVVRTFPLRYAWATDHTMLVDGQSITIRGVASILNSMYGNNAPSTENTPLRSGDRRVDSVAPGESNAGRAGTRALSGLNGNDRNGGKAPLPPGGIGQYAGGGSVAPLPNGEGRNRADAFQEDGGSAPIIHADPRSNSVLVRDRADRMAAHQSLIESLDTRPAVLEISASIIEISESALEDLGVDWRLHNSHVDMQTGYGTNTQLSNPGSLDAVSTTANAAAAIAATPTGGVLTAVIGGASRYLMARISALQQTNQAHITASPKVATLDNTEAIMDSKQNFYVPVAGYQSADLYSISAGVSLRVLPMVVTDGGTSRIRMNIHIEDGQITNQMVGNLPVVNKSEINTQALINEGESLLIAGYSVDQQTKGVDAVPGLSKIPLLGALFRHDQATGQRFQRLFLLTPRVVAL
ncbi:type III secretion system outer membrane ring subunit SctC [Ralstonia holmesii]|uniref:Type 3 secretion system secretin n=1 Tax=Ralstonia holmesii TaxID=3058602 RepID=A0ABC8Q6W1_9RALS|nr:type III secretion system outer membrane ring subunit SctC [Ralstonia sp. LMG 32967]CAJ0778512.1 Type 3 secretion system secretin [Ralstonia sp. LMG 32967]CAJ0810190.1 Type 3 secretion system secretin [Ralstonia sp. LMG 32967]